MTPIAVVDTAGPGRTAPAGSIVAIASGKGGVGKTWLAITLAHALARDGARVLLCDGDLGLANVDVQLGLTPRGDLGAVAHGRMTVAQAVARHPGGFDVLAGCSGSGRLSALPADALDSLLDGLRDLAASYDRIVLDLGAGIDAGVRRMAIFADRLLVVVTDEPTSLTDAYAVLKLYAADRRAGHEARSGDCGGGGLAGVVVNQAANPAAGRRTYAALARACTAFLGAAPSLVGIVRRDEQVRAAIRRQTPLLSHAPDSPASTDVAMLARAL